MSENSKNCLPELVLSNQQLKKHSVYDDIKQRQAENFERLEPENVCFINDSNNLLIIEIAAD